MSVDPDLFRQVMAQWSSGITVITSIANEEWQGITANSFASVSLNPPLVSVNIDRKLYIHSIIAQSGVFAANILSADQVEWGKLFAGFFPDIQNRFEGIACETAVTGSPILPGVVGWLDCQVRHAFDVGDHTIFVGEVVAGGTPRAAPALAYHNRSWGEFVKQPPDKAQIIEIGPAEGLVIPTDTKIQLIETLVDAGVNRTTIGIFGDPMPLLQLADPAQVYSKLQKREGVIYSAVVLDLNGLDKAQAAGITDVEVAVSAHDDHSRELLHLPLSEAMEQSIKMISRTQEYGITVRGSILCAFGYRDSGDVETQAVVDIVRNVMDAGIQEIALVDSSGLGNPRLTRKLLTAVLAVTEGIPVSVRLNDTYGTGMANALAALEMGVTQFETAFGGLGSTLFQSGEDANLPSEDLIHLLHSMSVQTDIDLDQIARLSQSIVLVVGRSLPGKLHRHMASAEKMIE